jgi:hypothetical protein
MARVLDEGICGYLWSRQPEIQIISIGGLPEAIGAAPRSEPAPG